MAVREENLARTSMSVKGYATDGGGIFTATTRGSAHRLPRFEAESAIVELPVIRLPESLAGRSFDCAHVVRALRFRHSPDERPAEHIDPICQAELAVLQFG